MSGSYRNNKNYVNHENLRALAYMKFALIGLKRCFHSRKHAIAVITVDVILWFLIGCISYDGVAAELLEAEYKAALVGTVILGNIVVMIYWGMPQDFLRIMRRIERIPNFRNEDTEPPLLIKRTVIDSGSRIEEWTFQSYGIGFSEWMEPTLQEQIENALDVVVLGVKYGTDNTLTVLEVLNHPGPWPEIIQWNEQYLPAKNSQICVGLNRTYPIVIDLAKHPHYMIGGETGSGKTRLILSMIYQFVKKGYLVYLIDMKHFVDYSTVIPFIEKAVNDKVSLHTLLSEIVEEMHRRLAVIRESGCPNIDEYNQSHPDSPMPRIAVIIDEYMEAVVKTGDKAQKQYGEQIEAIIATLCKLSRAAGISVIIGLQRGGQDISGQIRSNTRVLLGSCNDNLAIVMTGSTELGRLIPPDSVGMFVTDNRQLFKGFFGGLDF